MTAQIEPKTWVQCIDAERTHGMLRENGVYYVEAIEPCYDPETERVVFNGVVLTGLEDVAFDVRRFKPLGGSPESVKRQERVGEPA